MYTMFFLRFSNIDYSLDHFDEYEKHFTVMNYGHQMRQVKDFEFIPELEKQYPNVKWVNIQARIWAAIKDTYLAATAPQTSTSSVNFTTERIRKCEFSRALYGVDVLLDSEFNPYLLEFNFCPDITRACKFNPEFLNDVFKLLFLNDTANGQIPSSFVRL